MAVKPYPSTLERRPCPVCGRIVSVRVIKAGDGTAARPVKHRNWNRPGGPDCDGRYGDVDL